MRAEVLLLRLGRLVEASESLWTKRRERRKARRRRRREATTAFDLKARGIVSDVSELRGCGVRRRRDSPAGGSALLLHTSSLLSSSCSPPLARLAFCPDQSHTTRPASPAIDECPAPCRPAHSSAAPPRTHVRLAAPAPASRSYRRTTSKHLMHKMTIRRKTRTTSSRSCTSPRCAPPSPPRPPCRLPSVRLRATLAAQG